VETWFPENDPEGVAFEYEVSGVNRCVPATSTVYVAGAAARINGNTARSMAITASRFSSNMARGRSIRLLRTSHA